MVHRLQLLLVLDSAVIFESGSRGTQKHILLSQIRDSSYLEGKVPVFIFPRNRVAQLYPQALCSISVASYNSQGYGGGIRTHPPTQAFLTVTGPAYNISVRTAYKTPFLCCSKIVAVETCLFAEPLLGNSWCIVRYFAAVSHPMLL
jgi:hypothetical protein